MTYIKKHIAILLLFFAAAAVVVATASYPRTTSYTIRIQHGEDYTSGEQPNKKGGAPEEDNEEKEFDEELLYQYYKDYLNSITSHHLYNKNHHPLYYIYRKLILPSMSDNYLFKTSKEKKEEKEFVDFLKAKANSQEEEKDNSNKSIPLNDFQECLNIIRRAYNKLLESSTSVVNSSFTSVQNLGKRIIDDYIISPSYEKLLDQYIFSSYNKLLESWTTFYKSVVDKITYVQDLCKKLVDNYIISPYNKVSESWIKFSKSVVDNITSVKQHVSEKIDSIIHSLYNKLQEGWTTFSKSVVDKITSVQDRTKKLGSTIQDLYKNFLNVFTKSAVDEDNTTTEQNLTNDSTSDKENLSSFITEPTAKKPTTKKPSLFKKKQQQKTNIIEKMSSLFFNPSFLPPTTTTKKPTLFKQQQKMSAIEKMSSLFYNPSFLPRSTTTMAPSFDIDTAATTTSQADNNKSTPMTIDPPPPPTTTTTDKPTSNKAKYFTGPMFRLTFIAEITLDGIFGTINSFLDAIDFIFKDMIRATYRPWLHSVTKMKSGSLSQLVVQMTLMLVKSAVIIPIFGIYLLKLALQLLKGALFACWLIIAAVVDFALFLVILTFIYIAIFYRQHGLDFTNQFDNFNIDNIIPLVISN